MTEVNSIAPEDSTAWYRKYWENELIRLGLLLGAGFLVALAGVLYFVVTRPIVAGCGH